MRACDYCGQEKPTIATPLLYHDTTEGKKGELTKGTLELCGECKAKMIDKYPLAISGAKA